MIKMFIVDGEKYECDSRGVPNTDRRAKRRVLQSSEQTLEKKFLSKLKSTGFTYRHSESANWISRLTKDSKPKRMMIYSFAKFFSLFLDMDVPREAYRRSSTCLYWIDDNLKEISKICSEKKIFAVLTTGNVIKLSPPEEVKSNNQPTKKEETPEIVPIIDPKHSIFKNFEEENSSLQSNKLFDILLNLSKCLCKRC